MRGVFVFQYAVGLRLKMSGRCATLVVTKGREVTKMMMMTDTNSFCFGCDDHSVQAYCSECNEMFNCIQCATCC